MGPEAVKEPRSDRKSFCARHRGRDCQLGPAKGAAAVDLAGLGPPLADALRVEGVLAASHLPLGKDQAVSRASPFRTTLPSPE